MDRLFESGPMLSRLRDGAFGQYTAPLDQLVDHRLKQGYSEGTLRLQVRGIVRFGEWLRDCGMTVSELEPATLTEFLESQQHSRPVRRCTMMTAFLGRVCGGSDSSLQREERSGLDSAEESFRRYLLQERGLAPLTVLYYVAYARQFLSERFGHGPVMYQEIDAQEVIDFILRHAHDHSPGRAKLMVTALRSQMRFLFLKGETRTNLAVAIPTVASWRLQTLPRGMDVADVEALLRHTNRDTDVGRRDYAILVILARLGLRAHEVANLSLDDIDWEAGTVTICGKGRRVHSLPLPHDVGAAIVEYVRHGRPSCSTRRVFVRAAAPRTGFLTSHTISNVVDRGLRRAGRTPAYRGAHALRHSLATEMLRCGASLSEIGHLLRHRHQDTTAIYAKVDLNALRSVAHAWPGGAV